MNTPDYQLRQLPQLASAVRLHVDQGAFGFLVSAKFAAPGQSAKIPFVHAGAATIDHHVVVNPNAHVSSGGNKCFWHHNSLFSTFYEW